MGRSAFVSGMTLLLALALGGCGQGVRESASRERPRSPAPQSQPRPAPSPEANQPAKDFTLTTLRGEKVRLSSLQGKPVLINFWASWCPPCQRELPALEAAYQKYHGQGLEIIGVGAGDSEGALRSKAAQMKLTYPVGLSDETAGDYGVRGLPTSYFVAKDGKIVSVVMGEVSSEQLETELKKIL